MAIKQIAEHIYEADEDTTRKELKEAGWISSVKLSRMEDMWAVALLKRDINGLVAAGLEILSFHGGCSKKYYYREEQVVPALRAMQKYLCNRNINHVYESGMERIRDFWRQYNG
jgi:hypothetical protein